MTGNIKRSQFSWTPAGWDDFSKYYPQTPRLTAHVNSQLRSFSNIWEKQGTDNRLPAALGRHSGDPLVVLVRGVFGNLMPGNLLAVLEYLHRGKVRAIRPRTYVAGAIEDSAALLQRQVRAKLASDDSVIWLCQSRGGLDTLWALRRDRELHARTAGVILVQTPSAASAVMQSILTDCYAASIAHRSTRLVEKVQKAMLSLPAFRHGCRQLTAPAIDEYVQAVQDFSYLFPILSVASWSIEPSSWVDSFHRRLGEIRPGCAHDGQFYLEDQLWPTSEQLILGRIDHAQSVMGGNGFDPVRFWMALIELLGEQMSTAGVTRNSTPRTQNATSI